MSAAPPVQRAGVALNDRRVTAAAVAAALALHAVWLAALPAPRMPAAGGAGEAPTAVGYESVRSWRALQREHRSDPRLLHSPTLFALPTPLGFSGGELAAEIRSAPRVEIADGAAPVPPATPVLPPLQEASRWSQAATGRVELALDRTPVFAAVQVSTGRALVARWSADFTGAVVRTLPAADAVWADAASWEAVASVWYDADGGLREVFLDPPGVRADRNAAIVRLARTLPAPAGGAGVQGRITFRYTGSGGGGGGP